MANWVCFQWARSGGYLLTKERQQKRLIYILHCNANSLLVSTFTFSSKNFADLWLSGSSQKLPRQAFFIVLWQHWFILDSTEYPIVTRSVLAFYRVSVSLLSWLEGILMHPITPDATILPEDAKRRTWGGGRPPAPGGQSGSMIDRSGVLHWQEGEGFDMVQLPLRKMSATDWSTGGVNQSDPPEEHGNFLREKHITRIMSTNSTGGLFFSPS